MEACKDRHKTVRCNVCGRCMLSNKLKRHVRTHKDILTMSNEEARLELRNRNAVQMQREERRQNLMKIAQQENIPIHHCNDQLQPSTLSTDMETLE